MKNHLVAMALALPAVGWAETYIVSSQWIKAEIQSDTRIVSVTKTGDTAPFAKFTLPKGTFKRDASILTFESRTYCVSFVAKETCPFLMLTLRPGGDHREPSISLPDITIHASDSVSHLKALGTAGLTAVDQHPGSYMFLSVANPKTRAGVVGGWMTSISASGIVFSEKAKVANQYILRAESQYGRPVAKSEKTRGEVFLLGKFDDCRLGLEAYADQIASYFKIKMKPQIAGYCTWYSNKHGGAGDEKSTREFADAAEKWLKPYGFSFFQIDDKWQCGVKTNGPAKVFLSHNPNGPYPSGMKATADYLKSKGFRAGLWFMPFSGSQLDPWYAERKHWFVKSAMDYPPAGEPNQRPYKINQKKREPYETFWGGTSLDMTHPEVAKHMTHEVSQITRDWGYEYYKYDGMWTAMACEQLYVNDGYRPDDMGKQIFFDDRFTNVEAFRLGLQRVRDVGGEKVFILGCNVSQNMRTMGAAYGLVDAMRIGPDNGASWHGVCAGPIRGSARYFYNGKVWYNDPDPVYVRDSIPLDRARLSATWVAISGQLFAFSDWLPELSKERLEILQKTIGPTTRAEFHRPEDLFESPVARIWQVKSGKAHILGLFNWKEKEEDRFNLSLQRLGLDPNAEYAAFDFWGNQALPTLRKTMETTLPKASCRVIALRKLESYPVVVSTSRHVLSPFFEVTEERWNPDKKRLTGCSEVIAGDRYELRVMIPADWKTPSVVVAADDPEVRRDGNLLRVSWKSRETTTLPWSLSF